ncbi:MAG: HigA family addiction module antitoxin [Rhodospirillaceae bacterium]
MNRLPNIHPGEILREEFLLPLGITAYRLSKDIGVPQTRISEIVAERRSVTADTAARLGRYFDTSPRFWLNLQTAYDLEEIEREKAEEISAIRVYSNHAVSTAIQAP